MTSKITVELPRAQAQLLANFFISMTFETFAQFTNSKDEAYDLRDATGFLLRQLRDHVTPRPRAPVAVKATPDDPQLQYAHIPLRFLGANATKHVREQLHEDIRRCVTRGNFPQWSVSDLDVHLITIGPLAEKQP
jgi:hypothetical protein